MLDRLLGWIPGEPEIEGLLHELGIHGPQLMHWLRLAMTGISLMTTLGLVLLLAARLTSGVRRRGAAWLAIGVLLAGGLSGWSFTVAGRDAVATPHPVSVHPSPLSRPFHWVQAVQQACIAIPLERIPLPASVGRGDYLVLVFASQGYGARPSTLRAVSDDRNGAWARLYQSSVSRSKEQRVQYAVFRVAHSRPGRLQITLNTSAGQAGATVAVFDVSGVGGEDAADFGASVVPSPTGSLLSPATHGSTPAEDLVLGLFGVYSYDGQTMTPAQGWTMDVRAGSPNCSAVAIQHLSRRSDAGPQQAELLTSTVAFGTGVIVLRP